MAPRLLLYNVALFTLGILSLPWVLYQLVFVRRRRKGFRQRMGNTPEAPAGTIWCHAVSVGEVRAITPLLSLLQEDDRTSGRIVLSTVTDTGQETALRECAFVSSIFYFPLDLPFSVRRAISRTAPAIFITAETEIWPNFFTSCFHRNIPVVVVNGRISDKSNSRYLKFRWFFRPILARVSMFLMQSDEDAQRILKIGARPETVSVTGNMKYDRLPAPVQLPDAVRSWAQGKFLLVAGSTHAGEEEAILDAVHQPKIRTVRLALVPRHPERFDEVARLLQERSVLFTRYTEILETGHLDGEVVLVDAMGVLDGFYALADAAFVGGSLMPIGGHNLLEPAMHGVPVLTGPHLQNFRNISRDLLDSGGCEIVNNSTELGKRIMSLAGDKGSARVMGQKAMNVYKRRVGASEKNMGKILELLAESDEMFI